MRIFFSRHSFLTSAPRQRPWHRWIKMAATVVEKAFCLLELAKTNSVTLVQRHFRRRYGKRPPTRQSIYDWNKKFQETGCLSLIISFQYNNENVYFFYSNPIYSDLFYTTIPKIIWLYAISLLFWNFNPVVTYLNLTRFFLSQIMPSLEYVYFIEGKSPFLNHRNEHVMLPTC